MSQRTQPKIKNIINSTKILNSLSVWDFKDKELLKAISNLNKVMADVTNIIRIPKVVEAEDGNV